VETHLASCRDCRALVAALAGDEADSNAATRKHEKIAEDSQVAKRPVLSVGDRVGRYLVLSSLGAGGMGVVFAAYDPQLDRKVALKLLRGNLGVNAKEARTRLKREAQAIAQLNHPNVVGVYDVGTTEGGEVYIAMEFVEGDTLTSWLKKWPRTWREILDVFQQAARGLMAAHSVGLLHRDFKPDNVLVGPGKGSHERPAVPAASQMALDAANCRRCHGSRDELARDVVVETVHCPKHMPRTPANARGFACKKGS
jgi:serine/threonine protein kinase